MSYLGNSPGVASQRVESAFTATSAQTVFTPSSGYTLGYCDVYQNGVKLVNGDDYTAADGATVTLATGAATGDSIVIVASFPRGLSDGYLKSEADAKYAPIAAPTFTGVATFSKGSSSGVTIGDVTTNSNSVLRMQGTSAGKNWQIANNLNVTGIEFTPSTADGGTTYTTPAVTFLSSGNVGIGTSSPTQKLAVNATSGEYIRVAGKSSAAVSSDLTISRTSSSTSIVQAPNLYFDDGTTNNTRAIQCGAGNLQFWAYRGGWTEDARIDTSGNLSLATGNLVLASGKGIDFSATGNGAATMQSELLDDYERGTWTASSGSSGYTCSGTGYYVKVGRMVFASVYLQQTCAAASGTVVAVMGLPYVSDGYHSVHCGYYANGINGSYSGYTESGYAYFLTNASYNTGTNVGMMFTVIYQATS